MGIELGVVLIRGLYRFGIGPFLFVLSGTHTHWHKMVRKPVGHLIILRISAPGSIIQAGENGG